MQDFIDARKTCPNIKIPEKVKNNFEAAKNFNPKQLTGLTREWIMYQVKLEGMK
jgi:hypothetical protein